MNNGRVVSKNAGAASKAVAVPALTAKRTFLSLSKPPICQTVCPIRSNGESSVFGRVNNVFGACGRTFGKSACRRRVEYGVTKVATEHVEIS